MSAGVLVPVVVALVDVDVAVGPVETRPTGATVAVPQRGAGGTVPAGLTGTVIRFLAIGSLKHSGLVFSLKLNEYQVGI